MAKKQKSPVVEEEEEPTPPLDLAAARLVKIWLFLLNTILQYTHVRISLALTDLYPPFS